MARILPERMLACRAEKDGAITELAILDGYRQPGWAGQTDSRRGAIGAGWLEGRPPGTPSGALAGSRLVPAFASAAIRRLALREVRNPEGEDRAEDLPHRTGMGHEA